MTRRSSALVIASVWFAACAFAFGARVPNYVVGAWTGRATVYREWTDLEGIDVALHIASEGSASGTVGGAVLRDARVAGHRGLFGRIFRYGPDFELRGRIEGRVVADLGPPAAGIVMSLNWERDHFAGGFIVTSPRAGVGREVIETAGRMRLFRIDR